MHLEMAAGAKWCLLRGLEELTVVPLCGTLCKSMVNTKLSE